MLLTRAWRRSRRPLRRRGVSACASAWRERGRGVGGRGSPGGCCLFCSCQVAYGERRETHSGGRLGRRRFVSGGHAVSTEEGKKHCSSRWGFYAKHFITCVFRRRAAFCFFPLDYRGGALFRVMMGMINVLTRSRRMTPRACVRTRPRCCLSAVLPSF